ncbi:MAG: RNA methyltransferase [Chloroflexi bacterium]|nr:RNA methyltransferase [Chloroflexota bacterium]
MASLTTEYEAAFSYMQRAKRHDCRVADPDAPELLDSVNIGYLSHGLGGGNGVPASVQENVQVFATGWTNLDGIMIVAPEPDFNADRRVCIAASNERALQDLLLSFPAGLVGFFYFAADWMLAGIEQAIHGRALPAREGYFATEKTFIPYDTYPARAIGDSDYPLVRGQWSESVWNELLAEGYCFHACDADEELSALCFHWEVEPWRNEVHGLQAAKDFARPFAECAISSATAHVLAAGKVATCTANRDDDDRALGAFRRVGYRKFYRIPSYLGARRGGQAARIPEDAFHRTEQRSPIASAAARSPGPGEGRIARGKDTVFSRFCELTHERGRREHGRFLVEGIRLVERAIADGLAVECLLYTPSLIRCPEGVALLSLARQSGMDHYQVTEGLMAKVTTSRPPAVVVAAIHFRTREAAGLVTVPGSAGADPLHKNCVRAARGAVGRIPLMVTDSPAEYLRGLGQRGFEVIAAALNADHELYESSLAPPVAVVVGSEGTGLTRAVLDSCSSRVFIPMAPGQDSLNVGVAAGVLLYEAQRQRQARRSNAPLILP